MYKNKTLAELLSKKALDDQLWKCEHCVYKYLNDIEEAWCFMYNELYIECSHFKFSAMEN